MRQVNSQLTIKKSVKHLRWKFFHKKLHYRFRSSRPEVFCKKGVLEISQNSQESTCARDSFLIKLQAKAWNFIKKESLRLVFSCEFCEISKNIFFYITPLVAASIGFF